MNSEIEKLIERKAESANLDYKGGFKWHKENRDLQFELLRDIMAMANTRDGGTIIFGVEDGSFELKGVSEAIRDSLDQTDIAQRLHCYGSPKAKIDVQKAIISSKHVVVVSVAEFEDVPIICTDSIKRNQSKDLILRKGAIYIRTSAATTEEISSEQDMRDLIGRAMTKRADELVRNIEIVIKGKPIIPTKETENLYQKEIHESDKWLTSVLQKGFLNNPRWELIVYPSNYEPERIKKLLEVENIVRECQVELRGWPFPYVSRDGGSSIFNSGFNGFVDAPDIREGFRFYQSGLFIFKRTLWEHQRQLQGQFDKKCLSFISAVESLTEFLLFISRIYETLDNIKSLHLVVNLIGCSQRQLASFDGRVPFHDWYVSQDDVITWEKDIQMIELHATHKEIARLISMHIFHVFNWRDVREDVIRDWQDRLLNRRF